MEGSPLLSWSSSSYPKTHLNINLNHSSLFGKWAFIPKLQQQQQHMFSKVKKQPLISVSCHVSSLRTLAATQPQQQPQPLPLPTGKEVMPKIDKSGRFCSPRAARELALLIVYASCLQGSDPIRLFEKRMNSRREPGYEFDKESLLEYNHMSFGGPPVTTHTIEEADELQRNNDKESTIEAEVLSAPPKLVYSKLVLRFTRKLLVAVVERWDSHVLIIDQIAPQNWKNQPAGRILELCILHLAMSEITVIETRHQIVINEAVDLAKRFCDGAAPRIINGCLGTFVKGLREIGTADTAEAKQKVSVEVSSNII